MRNILILAISVFFIVGCSFHSAPKNGKEIEVTSGQRIYTKSGSISATAPHNFPKTPFEGYTRFDEDLMAFNRHLPNMMSEDVRITVSAIPKDDIAKVSMLHKDKSDQMEEKYLNFKISDWEKKNNAERGVNTKLN